MTKVFGRKYNYIFGGGAFEGRQRYSAQDDNIYSKISKSCLTIHGSLLWYEKNSGLFNINYSMKDLDDKKYIRCLNIDSMPENIALPEGLLEILKDNEFEPIE